MGHGDLYLPAVTQHNIQILDKIIFFKYRTRQIKAIETNKVTYRN